MCFVKRWPEGLPHDYEYRIDKNGMKKLFKKDTTKPWPIPGMKQRPPHNWTGWKIFSGRASKVQYTHRVRWWCHDHTRMEKLRLGQEPHCWLHDNPTKIYTKLGFGFNAQQADSSLEERSYRFDEHRVYLSLSSRVSSPVHKHYVLCVLFYSCSCLLEQHLKSGLAAPCLTLGKCVGFISVSLSPFPVDLLHAQFCQVLLIDAVVTPQLAGTV